MANDNKHDNSNDGIRRFAEQATAGLGRERNNWRELVMGLIGALLALSGFFAKSALEDLRTAVASATQRTEAAAAMINSHSTKIELLELRVTQHDQRIDTLERKSAAK